LVGQTPNPMDENDLVQALTEVIKDDEKQIEELKQRLEFITERRDRNKNLLNSILKIEELNIVKMVERNYGLKATNQVSQIQIQIIVQTKILLIVFEKVTVIVGILLVVNVCIVLSIFEQKK
jgi:hypothetical protein